MDGITLSETMHSRGINIRYLGKVCNLLAKVKQLEYLHSIAVGEIILRSAKHIFTAYLQVIHILAPFLLAFIYVFLMILQGTEMMNFSVAVAHFLNCFLYSGSTSNPLQGIDEVSHS